MNKYAHLAPAKPRWEARRCATKVRWVSEGDAAKAAVRLAMKHGNPLTTYRCVMCLGWHTTSKVTSAAHSYRNARTKREITS